MDEPRMNPGFIWHDALTTPQSSRIRAIHVSIGQDVLGSFEHFEAGFLRELKIDEEIVVYEKIVKAFVAWREDNPDACLHDKKLIIRQMIFYTLNKGKLMKEVAKYFEGK